MSRDDYIEDLLSEKITFNTDEAPSSSRKDDAAHAEEVRNYRPPASEKKKDTSKPVAPGRDVSVFSKDVLGPMEGHFLAAEKVKAGIKPTVLSDEAMLAIKPVMYDLNKNLEDIASEAENLAYDLSKATLDEAAHKVFYNYFEAGKDDRRLAYIKLRITFEKLYLANRTMQPMWERVRELFQPMLLDRNAAEAVNNLLEEQVEPKVLLCKQTKTFLEYMAAYLKVKGLEEKGTGIEFNTEYHDSYNYIYEFVYLYAKEMIETGVEADNSVSPTYISGAKEKPAEKPAASSADVDDLPAVEPELPGSTAPADSGDGTEGLPPAAGEPPAPAVEPPAESTITAIDTEDIAAGLDFIESPAVMPVEKKPAPKPEPEAEPAARLPSEGKAETGDAKSAARLRDAFSTTSELAVNMIGNKDWNTSALYQLNVHVSEVRKAEQMMEQSFKLSVNEEDKFKKYSTTAAYIRSGQGKGQIVPYREMIYRQLHKIRAETLIVDFPELKGDLVDIFIFHITPRVYMDIVLAVMRHGRFGFMSYLDARKEIVTTYPKAVVKAEVIQWWNHFQENLNPESVNTYLNYSRLVDVLKSKYEKDYETARKKLAVFTKNYSDQIPNYNEEVHFQKHRYNFFSPARVHVYMRFVPRHCFKD